MALQKFYVAYEIHQPILKLQILNCLLFSLLLLIWSKHLSTEAREFWYIFLSLYLYYFAKNSFNHIKSNKTCCEKRSELVFESVALSHEQDFLKKYLSCKSQSRKNYMRLQKNLNPLCSTATRCVWVHSDKGENEAVITMMMTSQCLNTNRPPLAARGASTIFPNIGLFWIMPNLIDFNVFCLKKPWTFLTTICIYASI